MRGKSIWNIWTRIKWEAKLTNLNWPPSMDLNLHWPALANISTIGNEPSSTLHRIENHVNSTLSDTWPDSTRMCLCLLSRIGYFWMSPEIQNGTFFWFSTEEHSQIFHSSRLVALWNNLVLFDIDVAKCHISRILQIKYYIYFLTLLGIK